MGPMSGVAQVAAVAIKALNRGVVSSVFMPIKLPPSPPPILIWISKSARGGLFSWGAERRHLPDAARLDLALDLNGLRALGLTEAGQAAIPTGERTGRPLGDADFVAGPQAQHGRTLARRKPKAAEP